MQKTRFVIFLRSLNATEVRKFRDFVNSPVFNKNESIVKLFDILIRHHPDFDRSDLTEENIFSEVYGKEKYDYFKMKNLTSDLLGLGKEFLTFINFKKDIEYKEINLLRELRFRNMDVMFEDVYKSASKRMEKVKVKDEKYLNQMYELKTELMNFNSPKKPNANFHYFQEKLDLLVDYSLIRLLKCFNVMVHEKYQNNYKFDLKMFDSVMQYLSENINESNPTLQIYYYIILLNWERNDEAFFKLTELKKKYTDELDAVDNYMTYLHLDSYCASAYNEKGRTDLLYEQFELSKVGSMNHYPELGRILYPDFLNEIKKAVRVDELDYAVDYIEKFRDNLTAEKENTLNFCYGFIAYRKGDLDEALELFSKTNFSNFLIKIQVKILLLQLYYDKKYFEQALLMVDSFRHYVLREKLLLDKFRTSVLDFLKIISGLIKINLEISMRKKLSLIYETKLEIENLKNNQFGMKLWLSEKIGAIGTE